MSFYVEDLQLAASLVVLGVEPFAKHPTVNVNNNGRQTTRFFFVESNDALKWVEAWSDREKWKAFEAANPSHDLVTLRCGFTMRNRYLDAIKQSATLHVVPSKRIAGAFELRTVPAKPAEAKP